MKNNKTHLKKSPLFFLLLCSFALPLLNQCKREPLPQITETPPPNLPSFLQEKIKWNFGQQAHQHATSIVSFGPRPPQSKELEQSRQYVQAELEKRGWLVKRQAFITQTPKGKMQFVNLYARYQGKGQTPQQVWQREHKGVLGAHIDSKNIPGMNYLGAVDAAGSVGAVIEIGDYLGKHHPKAAETLELVFFDGEEAVLPNIIYTSTRRDGLYGSHYYALHRNGQRDFGLILDLLGHKNQQIAIPPESTRPGYTPPKMAKTFRNIIKKHKLEKDVGFNDRGIIDDHLPLAIFGTPSMVLIGEFSSDDGWWHAPGDTIDKLSAEKLGVSIKIALEILATEVEASQKRSQHK